LDSRGDKLGSDWRAAALKILLDTANLDENYGYRTQILSASLRSPTHVSESALAGAHIATMPFKAQFQKDWAKAFQEEPVGR
jgi:transaldolase